ncbi:MAG TPA: hypothetical protein VIN04_04945 [Myxococcota bacterium]
MSDGGREQHEEAPLVVIDPSAAERERLAAAEQRIGAPVRALGPDGLRGEARALLARARAVLVAWDLGTQLGLDLVEALAHDPATRAVPVALAADAPTRTMAELALRAGARALLVRPCDPDDLARVLLRGPAPASSAGAPKAPSDAQEATA